MPFYDNFDRLKISLRSVFLTPDSHFPGVYSKVELSRLIHNSVFSLGMKFSFGSKTTTLFHLFLLFFERNSLSVAPSEFTTANKAPFLYDNNNSAH